MAFYIGADKVISDTDATAGISTNSDLDKLQINGTDVLTHSGGVVTLKNVTFDDASEVSINTDNISEGTTNRFYTAARQTEIETYADTAETDAISTANTYTDTQILTVLPLSGGTLTGLLTLSGAPTNALHATTKSYVDSAVTSGTSGLDTDDVAEGSTNLYYTDARVDTHLSTDMGIGGASGNAELSGTLRVTGNIFPTNSTSDLGTTGGQHFNFVNANNINLYDNKIYFNKSGNHTELRAQGTSSDILISLPTTTGTLATTDDLANLVDSAPATLDTLNELAAALGDDPNFATTVTNQIAALTHDGFADFVANEHIDWTQSGAGTIDPSNYTNTNTNTTYTAGTGLTLTGTVFSNDITNNNQLTNGAGYITSFTDTNTTYTAGTGMSLSGTTFNCDVVNTDTNTTYTAGNGLVLSGTEFTMDASYTGDFEFDGVLTATGDVVAYSDKRLKRNIETISNPIDIVNCLRGVNFEKDGRHSTGVIAQEVEEFLPEVVHTDAEGMKAVAYGNIAGLLIEAIKEQQQTIENLQKQLTDLQNKNS
jgi:hypothetical protein